MNTVPTTTTERKATTETSRSALRDPLAGIAGSLRIMVDGEPAGVLRVQNGTARFEPDDGAQADAVISCTRDNEDYVRRVLRGELNPVVALLQGRYELGGNAAFAVHVLWRLQRAKVAS